MTGSAPFTSSSGHPAAPQKTRPMRSVRVRLTLWNAGVMTLLLCVLGVVLRVTLQATVINGIDNYNANIAQHIQDHIEQSPSLEDALPPRMHQRLMRQSQSRDADSELNRRLMPRLLAPDGHPLTHALPDAPIDLAGFRRATTGVADIRTIHVGRVPVRVLSQPVTRGGQPLGVLQLSWSLVDTYDQIDRVTGVLLALIPVAVIVAAIGGAFLTGRALEPVRQITATAARIEAENLHDRLDVPGHDEFALLAATFNGMLDRLENAFRRLEQLYEQQRRFTGDASHELRTPLTIIKANASLALASASRTPADYVQALKTIDAAADRTNRIIQDLLLFARADAGQLALDLKPVSVAEVIDQARAQTLQAASVGERETAPLIREPVDPELQVTGRPDMLARMLVNLLQNALRHTPASGTVQIGAATGAGETVMITVRDTGEGIAPEHLPHLTERFYRADSSRARDHGFGSGQGGTGLGLAICRSIAEAHGGSLGIASEPGNGTIVTIVLPRLTAATHAAAAAAPSGAPESMPRPFLDAAEADQREAAAAITINH